MVQVQQRILAVRGRTRGRQRAALVALAVFCAGKLDAARFLADDPLATEPPPLPVSKALKRDINEYFDFFQNTFFRPANEDVSEGRIPRAGNVNTLGEVPDSAWFQNRMGTRGMPREELLHGTGSPGHAPSMAGPWSVLSAKNQGVTPGLMFADSSGRRYLLKFDPPSNPELASAADVIGSKFFYALGYNVPENYIVRFTREQLKVAARSRYTDKTGHRRSMTERDIDVALAHLPREGDGRFRAMASLILEGEAIGPFRYYGTRSDDPNDIVAHEDRRELRGLRVFAAWLNHTDSKSINTLDTLVKDQGTGFIRHHLIDFGAILGSDSFEAKSPRAGNVYFFAWKPAAAQFLSLGLYAPAWQRAHYPHIPSVGNFESKVFDPIKWKPNYPNPAFDHCLPDDAFWAAKKVMAFRDSDIRALVETGEFSDPEAVEYLTSNLIVRRDKIGRAYFSAVLPLDGFAVRGGKLVFEDLGVKYGFTGPRSYKITWSRFDNRSETQTPLPDETGENIPRELERSSADAYYSAEIRSDETSQAVIVYLRKREQRIKVVGIDRRW